MSDKAKEILFEEDARNKLGKESISWPTSWPSRSDLADAMSDCKRPGARPRSPATAIRLQKMSRVKDPFANMGVSMGKELAAQNQRALGRRHDDGHRPLPRPRSSRSEKHRLRRQSHSDQARHGQSPGKDFERNRRHGDRQ